MLLRTFVTTIAFTVITNLCNAQTYVNVNGGIQASNVVWRNFSTKEETKTTFGYRAGLTIATPITFYNHELFIQPGLFFSRKGFQDRYEDHLGKGKYRVHPYYVELPVNVLYLIPNRDDKNVFIGAGPYAAYAFGGYWEVKFDKQGRYTGGLEFTDIKNQTPPQPDINDDKFNYGKRLDYGMNFLIGYQFMEQLQIQLNSQIGLRNIAPKQNDKSTTESFKNYTIGLSLGYTL